MKKDFFISYNKADREWALWIAQQLEGAGYSTIIQAADMPPGSNFVLEMHQAATAATRTIAVLSPDFLQSQFTQPEWAAAFAKDPTSANRTLLPVRVRECQPTGLLAQLVYIDLVGKAGEEARQLLLAGLNRERERLSLPVRFPVDELLEKYCQHLAARVSTVRIFGDEAPHPLDQVFVELSLNEEYERRPNQAEFLGLMDSELRRRRSVFGDADDRRELDADDPTQRHFAKAKRTLKPDELLRRHTHAVITGAPGCGKTTLLRYLAWQTLKHWRESFVAPPSGGQSGAASSNRLASEPQPPEGGTTNARLPVFLELKQLTATAFEAANGQLEDLLFNAAIAARLKPNEAERAALKQHFYELLRAGRVAVFLDGLDEVSGAGFFGDLQKMVSEFLQSAYGHNPVIISTRPYALRQFGHAKMLEILPLNPRQIEQFIAHYYCDVPERQQFQRELQRRRELRELARVPALLGFILQLWRKQGTVTDDKLELYAQITLELAAQLDREKEGIAPDRQWLVEDKDGSLKLDLLRQLAFNQLFKGLIRPPYDIGSTDNDATRLVFTGEQLRDETIAFARVLKEREGLNINPRHLAEDVKATALLRQVGADHYAFAHLTLQEYLAAWQLAKRDNGDTCERIFCRSYFNPTLAEMEVLPLTLGLVNEPDRLYEALEQLPDSLTFIRFRLQLRGLSCYANIDHSLLEKFTSRLIGVISNDDSEEAPYRDVILQALSGVGGNNAAIICKTISQLLHSDDPGLRIEAAKALGLFGNVAAIEPLIIAINDQDQVVRECVVEALGEIGDARVVEPLIEMLNNSDFSIRYRAVDALGNCGGRELTLHLLNTALHDEDELVQMSAASALRKSEDATAIELLLAALNSPIIDVAKEAAVTLGRIGNLRAVEPLIQILKHQNILMCGYAVLALGWVGDARATDPLIAMLSHQDCKMRELVARALGEIGDSRAAEALAVALSDEDPDVRLRATLALGEIGDARSVEPLIALLNHEDWGLQITAIMTLGKIGDARAVEPLFTALDDQDENVRGSAVEALAKLDDSRVAESLIAILNNDKDPRNQVLAAAALGQKGGSSRCSTAHLYPYLFSWVTWG